MTKDTSAWVPDNGVGEVSIGNQGVTRLTESGVTRLTESGVTRVLEDTVVTNKDTSAWSTSDT
jgi:hypothetical protein